MAITLSVNFSGKATVDSQTNCSISAGEKTNTSITVKACTSSTSTSGCSTVNGTWNGDYWETNVWPENKLYLRAYKGGYNSSNYQSGAVGSGYAMTGTNSLTTKSAKALTSNPFQSTSYTNCLFAKIGCTNDAA